MTTRFKAAILLTLFLAAPVGLAASTFDRVHGARLRSEVRRQVSESVRFGHRGRAAARRAMQRVKAAERRAYAGASRASRRAWQDSRRAAREARRRLRWY
jgi:hypothetical protein